MNKLRGKYSRIDDLVAGLRQEVASLNKEVELGRGNKAWLTAEKNKASKKVQDKIREIRREIELDLIMQRAEANDMIKPSDRYNARAYHVQVATALAQGKKPEQLIEAFKGLDREQLEYKNEYVKVFGNKIDTDHSINWQQAVETVMTPEEREQHKMIKEVEEYKDFLPTLDTHIENRVVHAMSGEEVSPHDVPTVNIFDEVAETVDRRIDGQSEGVTEVKIHPVE